MWSNPHFLVDLVTFTEHILNGKIQFLYSVNLLNIVLNVFKVYTKYTRSTPLDNMTYIGRK